LSRAGVHLGGESHHVDATAVLYNGVALLAPKVGVACESQVHVHLYSSLAAQAVYEFAMVWAQRRHDPAPGTEAESLCRGLENFRMQGKQAVDQCGS
jgi:hypothetical protein